MAAIFWTNANPIHWRIYAALEGGGGGGGGFFSCISVADGALAVEVMRWSQKYKIVIQNLDIPISGQ